MAQGPNDLEVVLSHLTAEGGVYRYLIVSMDGKKAPTFPFNN